MIEKKYKPWQVCFAASLFFFYEFIQGNMFASLNSEVKEAFNLNIVGLSWLSSIYYVANVIFLFPAGIILDRFSTKTVILYSLSICVLGTFGFAIADSLEFALLCRFVTGIGSAFCFLSCFRIASRWFPPQKLALVTGLVVTLAMSGGMVAQAPMTELIVAVGWRKAVMWDGLLGLVILVLINRWVEDKPLYDVGAVDDTSIGVKHSFIKALKLSYGNAQNILAGLYASLMNMPVAVLGAFVGSVYLRDAHHYMRADAANINSMIFFGTIFGGPLIGYLSDKIQLRKIPMITCNVLSIFIVVTILYVPNISVHFMEVLFFMLGFFSSAQVLCYPLVAENNCPTITATAVSVVSVCTQGGFILYQQLFSYVLKYQETVAISAYSTRAYQHALLVIPYGFILALLAGFLLRETFGKRIEERV
jgi:MFS family permease